MHCLRSSGRWVGCHARVHCLGARWRAGVRVASSCVTLPPPYRQCSQGQVAGPSRAVLAVMADAASEGLEGREKVKVKVVNARGQSLVGYLDDTGSQEVVVLCHGFRSSKDSGTLAIAASGVLEAGISVFRFDFTGNGDSEGEFGFGNYLDEAEDLRAVVEHWRAQGRKISTIVGHSKGGCAVLLYASKYADVPTVINISGRCFTENGVKKQLGEERVAELVEKGCLDVTDPRFGSYRLTRKHLEQSPLTMTNEVVKIPASCRVFTIHGSEDDVVLVEDAYEFHKLISNHTLHIIEGGDHRFRRKVAELSYSVLSCIQPA